MNDHRLIPSLDFISFPTASPFSCFDFIKDRFDETESIHRCFSIARSRGLSCITVETIQPVGLVADENHEITSLYPDYSMQSLVRLGFWTCEFENDRKPAAKDAKHFIGYAICKKDSTSTRMDWHVFEAVFPKYNHPHNCVPNTKSYAVTIGDNEFRVTGIIYCQQNVLNKSCAQVALRSLLSRRLIDGDIAYSKINKIARNNATTPDWKPTEGLSPKQIRAILRSFDIPFRDIDYCEEEKTNSHIRHEIPYQKYIYAGVESGAGALLGFRFDGPAAGDSKHIIPFFGHTFNKDTWVPDADMSYFNIGGSVGYIPSESWTSSFIGHDDNFGPNFCVPRVYVKPSQADYVIELLPDQYEYGGLQAEASALPLIYSMMPLLCSSTNTWMQRMGQCGASNSQRIVLRALAVSKETYLIHLQELTDWNNNQENSNILDFLPERLPKELWVVEVSVPHLFPANQHKMGEIVLNPLIPFNSSNPNDYDRFILARLPSRYFFINEVKEGQPKFTYLESQLTSHTSLLTC